MRFVCLGYFDEQQFASLPPHEQQGFMDRCFDYDDVLRRGGHFLGGEALEGKDSAITLRLQQGQVVATDGPYAETKEILGGILLLEARDLNHAVALMSRHPGLRAGPFEIRPADETINGLIAARHAAVSTTTA
jgi:hypothetical protein